MRHCSKSVANKFIIKTALTILRITGLNCEVSQVRISEHAQHDYSKESDVIPK